MLLLRVNVLEHDVKLTRAHGNRVARKSRGSERQVS